MPDHSNELVIREDHDGVARLVLNRPEARNALSLAMIERLHDRCLEIRSDRSVRVVIIAGAGPAFCAGHDLRELRAEASRDFHLKVFERCAEMMMGLHALPQPVIAEVHGIATAAGCQLVATCDLAVAADDARFATPGVNIGLFCSTPMVALTRAVCQKAAMEMLLLGELISAEAAQRIGLVNRVTPASELRASTEELARRIVSKSAYTLETGKAAFYRQAEMDLKSAYAYTAKVMTENMQALDAAEGIDAFLEKRSPKWKGC